MLQARGIERRVVTFRNITITFIRHAAASGALGTATARAGYVACTGQAGSVQIVGGRHAVGRRPCIREATHRVVLGTSPVVDVFARAVELFTCLERICTTVDVAHRLTKSGLLLLRRQLHQRRALQHLRCTASCRRHDAIRARRAGADARRASTARARIHRLMRGEQRGQRRRVIRHATARVALTSVVVRHGAAQRARRAVVVDGLEAARKTDGLGLRLLDILRGQADLCVRRALVVEADDLETVLGVADRLDVLLEPLVGEERLRRRGAARGARAGKSTRALCDVGEELRDLKRVALLLQKLVVDGGVLRLTGLLRDGARADLCLTLRQVRTEQAGAQRGIGTSRRVAHVELALADAEVRIRGAKTLRVGSVADIEILVRSTETLSVDLLAETLVGRAEAHALRIGLVADVGEIGRTGLQRGTIGLRCAKADALLLLCGAERLVVVRAVEARGDVRRGKVLLSGQHALRNARAIAAVGTREDRVRSERIALLSLLLVGQRERAVDHRLRIRRHVLADVQRTGIDRLRAR